MVHKKKMLVQEKIHVVMIFFVVNMHFKYQSKLHIKLRGGMQDTAPETYTTLRLKELCSLSASSSGFSLSKF